MAPGESNGYVTRNVTWPRQVEVVTTICRGPLPKIWLEIRVELWLHVTLNFYTYRSSTYTRIEISYECYRWHWTDSVFFGTLSCYHINSNMNVSYYRLITRSRAQSRAPRIYTNSWCVKTPIGRRRLYFQECNVFFVWRGWIGIGHQSTPRCIPSYNNCTSRDRLHFTRLQRSAADLYFPKNTIDRLTS